ncbi:hypothetical protein QBC44DRAFT_369656 [Cladorrhinum sp. PSN332]|nr:hypothetical protein QBC44DRAFT_369656 [Cladorrhinum sp. PSN332]
MPIDKLRFIADEVRRAGDWEGMYTLGGETHISLPSRNVPYSRTTPNPSWANCVNRDLGTCVITGSLNPKPCNILNNVDEIQFYALLRTCATDYLSPSSFTSLSSFHTANPVFAQLGIGDLLAEQRSSSWNMLSLSPHLHKWWEEAYFGLQCLGVDTERDPCYFDFVKIQFRWLPRPKKQAAYPNELVPDVRAEIERIRRDIQQMAESENGDSLTGDDDAESPVNVMMKGCEPLIRSGFTFEIRMPKSKNVVSYSNEAKRCK